MTTAPGWYPDPFDGSQLRYWNGVEWTESVSPAGQAAQPQVGAQPQGGYQDPGYQDPGYQQAGSGTVGYQDPGYQTPSFQGQGAGYGYQTYDQAYGTATPNYGGTQPGQYGDVGDWLGDTFSRLFERIGPMVVLIFAIPVVGIVVALLLARSSLSDVVIDWSGSDVTVTGFQGGALAVAGIVGLITAVVAVVCWLGANHQMFAAHAGYPQSLGASLSTGLRRLPRAIGWGLLAYIAAVLAMIAAFLVIALVIGVTAGSDGEATAASGLLALLLFFVFFLLGVWLAVKLAFFGAALAVGPDGVNPFSASFDVTRSRWWGTFGRIVLLTFIVGLLTSIISGFGSAIFGPVLADSVTFNPTTSDVFINGVDVTETERIALSDLFPSAGALTLAALLQFLGAAVAQAINISGLAGLYHRGGGAAQL